MLNKINFDKVDKVLFEGELKSGLKLICAPMVAGEKEVVIGIYVNVGGLARNYSIGKQIIYPGTANIVAEALLKKHPKVSDPLFEKGVKLEVQVEESYTYFAVHVDPLNYSSYIVPLLSLVDSLSINNDEAEELKKDYLDKRVSLHDRELQMKLRNNLYFVSPMKKSFYGDKEDGKNIHFVSLKRFFNTFYVPRNMTMFAVGQISPAEVEKQANNMAFTTNDSEGEITVKSLAEDYTKVPVEEEETSKGDSLTLAVKMPLRQTVYEKYGDRVFAYYELVSWVLFSKLNKRSADFMSHVKSIKEKGIRQGGEDAFIYIQFAVDDKKSAKASLETLLSLPKSVGFFEFRGIKKEFLAHYKDIYKNHPEEYFIRLVDAFANSLADPSLIEEGYKASYSRFNSFLNSFKSYPRSYID